jgi:hypothetical protein
LQQAQFQIAGSVKSERAANLARECATLLVKRVVFGAGLG